MKVRKSILLGLMMVVLALVISACMPVATTSESSESSMEEPAAPKIAIITYTQEPDTLSPLYTGMWFSTITTDLWLNGLWTFDEANNPVPTLAAEIPSEANGGITNNGQTLTIHLREDAVWSDGVPFTAADVVFTYNMWLAPDNAVSSTYPYEDYVTSVEALDDHTIEVNLSEPFAPWVTSIFLTVLPEHVLGPIFEAEGSLAEAEWNRAPTVSIGPYVFSEWESGSHMVFTRNENWFGDPPAVDQIFIQMVPDDAAQIAAILAGDTDIGVFLNYADVPDIEGSGIAEVIGVGSGYDEGWFLNVNEDRGAHPAMLDPDVRRALALAVDRWQITEDLLLGKTEPPATFWANTPPFSSPDIEPYPYDPEEAAQLLDAAGWVDTNGDGIRDKDGVELVLRYITTDYREVRHETQAVTQQMLAEVGIGVDLLNYSSDVLWNTYSDGGPAATGEFDIAEWSDAPSFPDPDVDYWLCTSIPSDENPEGYNYSGYCNPDLDALFAEQATTTDLAKRQEIFAKIQQIMQDEVLWIGIWRDPDLWSLSNRLTGVKFGGAAPFWNVTDWTITE